MASAFPPYGTCGMALYVSPVMSPGGVGRPSRKGAVQDVEMTGLGG